MKQRYVIVGTGHRASAMFVEPLAKELTDHCEIVGLCDANHLRAELAKKKNGLTCPIFTDFDEMLAATKPDRAVICTRDATHHTFIIKCLEAGVQPISEKPMTTDAEKCTAILEAEKRSGIDVIVTFNCRFMPYVARVKKAVMDGVIGEVLNIDYEYLLSSDHGHDYFHRWHRQKKNSGGLLIHKASHHFDMINWIIDQEPVEVMAFGGLRKYGPNRAERGERCLTCKHTKTCEFFLDLKNNEFYKEMYLDCEKVDGYIRDTCVFSDDIDIEDTMSLTAKYSGGALLSYSLVAYGPYEMYKASINGTKGRLEFMARFEYPWEESPVESFTVFDQAGSRVIYELPSNAGIMHGGGDERLRRMIFAGETNDPLGQQAHAYQGALSMLVGAAANLSMAEGRNIKIKDMVDLDRYRRTAKVLA